MIYLSEFSHNCLYWYGGKILTTVSNFIMSQAFILFELILFNCLNLDYGFLPSHECKFQKKVDTFSALFSAVDQRLK